MRRFRCLFLSLILFFSLATFCFASAGYLFSWDRGALTYDGAIPPGVYYFEGVYEDVSFRTLPFYFDGSFADLYLVFEILSDDTVVQRYEISSIVYYHGGGTHFFCELFSETVLPLAYLYPLSSSVDATSLMSNVAGLFSGNFNVQNVLIVVVAAVGLSVGVVLLWFAFRYIKFKLSGALRKGKL